MIANIGRWFAHPFPGIVLFVGFGVWIGATVWAVIGAVLTTVTSLTIALVVVIAVALGVLGTCTILIGGIWYGVLLFLNSRAQRQRIEK